MKKRLIRAIIYMSACTIWGFMISFISVTALMAGNISAQSVKEVVIAVEFEEATLREALEEIESKTIFRFLYNKPAVELCKNRVNIERKTATVEEILNDISKQVRAGFRQADNTIAVQYPGRYALNEDKSLVAVSVAGKVTDVTSGESLPGVNIIVKGTTTGTSTDRNGNYELTVPSLQDTLMFSFIGYQTLEVPINGRSEVNVEMQLQAVAGEEVVVVGYGSTRKAHLTSSVDMVDGEVLENRPVQTVTEGLAGFTAGLNVDYTHGAPQVDSRLNIRGFTGFNEAGAPLVLVDGVEREISDVNPNDVESVSVLKDAAASAIYGSRAPYGVILITTKSGVKDQPIQVSYSGQMRWGTPSMLPQNVDSWVFAEKFNEGWRNNRQEANFTEEKIQEMKDYDAGLIDYNNMFSADGLWGRHWDANANNDWFDLATRDIIPSQQHNFGFSGGSQKTSYYMGLGYNESVGMFSGEGDHKDRYSALLKLDTDATDWLNLNLDMNYVITNESGPDFLGQGRSYGNVGGIFNVFSRTWPNTPHVNINPDAEYDGNVNWLSPLQAWLGELGEVSIDRNNFTITGGIEVFPAEGWVISGNYSWNNNSSHFERTTFPVYVINADGSAILSGRSPSFSQVIRTMGTRNYRTATLLTSYTAEINKHYFHMMGGYQNEYNLFKELTSTRRDLYTNQIPTLGTAYGDPNVDDVLSHWATEGYFLRASYNYDERYLLEFNGRYDAHSKFPEDIRWALFPSVSAAWNIARENFWPSELISNFKIRGSYTSSGDHGDGNYLYLQTMGTGRGTGDVILGGALPSMVFMPELVSGNLTWAKPQTLGLGLDVSVFQDRLELTYDWYQRTIHDQAGPAEPLPKTLGAAIPETNNAVSETRGWEGSLKWRDRGFSIAGKPFFYSMQFRMSDYIGYVVEYDDNESGVRNGTWTRGEEFGRVYLYESNGIAQDIEDVENNVTQGNGWWYPGDLMLRDLNGDGQISSGQGGYWYSMGDLTHYGYNYPRYRYSVTLEANWNGFDLSVLLNGVGHWTRYVNHQYIFGAGSQWHGGWLTEHERLGSWSYENPDAFFPRFYLNNTKNQRRSNDQYVLDLSHLRVQNIRLGYNLPIDLVNKMSLKGIYLYGSMENVGFLYYNSFINYDPAIIANTLGQGYPLQRVPSFGINIDL